MNKSLLTVVAAAMGLGACSGEVPTVAGLDPLFAMSPPSQASVTTDAAAGPGSFSAAIAAANTDPSISAIRFEGGLGEIALTGTITYTGPQDLTIDGRGAVIDASAATDGLVATGGASLTLHDLTIRDAGADGVFIDVPAGASGEIAVVLSRVTLSGHGEYGLHVDDQTNESAASIRLDVIESSVLNTGFAQGIDDKDGIRVDEGGEGGVVSRIDHATFTGNAADGIEYDEKGPGDVRVDVRNSDFSNNGTQPQLPSDLEDGFDIDEADDGSIYADFVNVTASHNEDGGIDLDEEGAGDIVMWLNQVVTIDNLDDNIKASEDADVEDTDPVDRLGWNRIPVPKRPEHGQRRQRNPVGRVRDRRRERTHRSKHQLQQRRRRCEHRPAGRGDR